MGSTLPSLSLTVTFPERASVALFSAIENSSFPLVSALVLTNVIQDWAPLSTSTVNSVLYWMSTVKVPPSAGILFTVPTWMVVLASCFTATEADRPLLLKVTEPFVSFPELAAAAVMVTVASPLPEVGETVMPWPSALAVQSLFAVTWTVWEPPAWGKDRLVVLTFRTGSTVGVGVGSGSFLDWQACISRSVRQKRRLRVRFIVRCPIL